MQNFIAQFFSQMQEEEQIPNNIPIKYSHKLIYKTNLKDCPNIAPYRMNLFAISILNQYIFIGCESQIKYYKILQNGTITFKGNLQTLLTSSDNENLINQIKLAFLNDREILVAVDMAGKVTIFNVNCLNDKPIVLDNTFPNIQDCSTWSLDVLLIQNDALLACGSNSHRISIWKLNEIYDFWKEQTIPFQSRIQDFRRVIQSFSNNIPSLKFSPCGTYLAGASIDKTVRVFNVQSLEMEGICTLKGFGWSVNWVLKEKTINFRNKKVKNQLEKYLIICSSNYCFYLIEPFCDSGKKQMVIVDIIDFNLQNNQMYKEISRYSIVHYVEQLNLAISSPQHTPFVDCFEVIFDIEGEKFKMQKTNIDLKEVIQGYTLGSYVQVKKAASCVERIVNLYILNKNRQLYQIEIKQKIGFNVKIEHNYEEINYI